MEAEASTTGRLFEIRTGLSHEDLLQIEQIQREIWGPDDVVPAPHLRAVEHAGGLVAAAFRGERVVGFSYGFLAAPHGRGMYGAGLHSHMVAVRNEGRGLGVGRSLKWHQRQWCLQRGVGWISWTFDPLQARNARLNLEHLGAVAFDYHVDFYGPMAGPLGGGQSSDRLLALWQLNAARVKRQLARTDLSEDEGEEVRVEELAVAPTDDTWALRADRVGPVAEPRIGTVTPDAPVVRVAVPHDVTRLLVEDPELAQRWRSAVGVTLTRLLEAGYVVMGFRDGGYVVKRELPG
jgi:predicted GNAT superfamily acetyltransferase